MTPLPGLEARHLYSGKVRDLYDAGDGLLLMVAGDQISAFDDFFRPIRSYFYWDKHCFDVPVCWTLRNLFDAIDGIAPAIACRAITLVSCPDDLLSSGNAIV